MSKFKSFLEKLRFGKDPDQLLIQGVREGKSAVREMALTEIYDRYFNKIYRQMRKKHSMLDEEDVLRAYAQALIELEKKIRSMDQAEIAATNLGALLYTITNRRCIDIVRAKTREKEKERERAEMVAYETGTQQLAGGTDDDPYYAEPGGMNPVRDTAETPEEELLSREMVTDIMAQLDEKARALLLDKKWGLTNDELAEKYGYRNKATVSVTLSKYKQKIIELLYSDE